MGQIDPTFGLGSLKTRRAVPPGGLFGAGGAGVAGASGSAASRGGGERTVGAGAVGDRDPAQWRAGAARLVRHEARGA